MIKKILTTVIISIIFSLTILISLFTIYCSSAEYDNMQEQLNNYVHLLVKSNINENTINNGYKINNYEVINVLCDKHGKTILSNHKINPEDNLAIINSISNKEGSIIIYSSSLAERVIYYGMNYSNDKILYVGVPTSHVSFFDSKTMMYLCIFLLITIIITILLVIRLIKIIVKPITDLEEVSEKIAKGDLKVRNKSNKNDEIALIGNAVNTIADKLYVNNKEVKDKQNKLELILSNMESGVIAVDEEGIILVDNSFAKAMFSVSDNIIGKKITDYITNDSFKEFFMNDDIDSVELKLDTTIERYIKVKKTKVSQINSSIKKVITIQDITELIRLENMRSQFVANVSHELKTPLTSIKGFAETLKYVEDTETRNKFIDIIDKESERLSRLINDILVLSKIESSKDAVEKEEFLASEIFDDVINMVNKKAEDNDIKVYINDTSTNFLYGSKDKFYQIVINLVENGIKYSKPGGYVKVNSYNNESTYYLEVEDNGIGIPKEDMPRIFERFYRVDKSRKSGGTGLGLAIVKHIIMNYNGDINVESIVDVGTKFTIKFNIL